MEPTLKIPSLWTILSTALLLAATTYAQQSSAFHNNLTLKFDASGQPCGHFYWGTNHSIIFTTSFYPAPGFGGCITLADVFGSSFNSNTSTGYRNTTYSYADNSGEYVHGNISFALTGNEFYKIQANYTSVFYSAYTYASTDSLPDDATHERWLEGPDVYFYRDEDCLQGISEDDHGESMPWYQTNCIAGDICQSLPFPVASFKIYRPAEDDKQPGNAAKGICVVGREIGAGNMLRPDSGWSLPAVVGAAIWQLVF